MRGSMAPMLGVLAWQQLAAAPLAPVPPPLALPRLPLIAHSVWRRKEALLEQVLIPEQPRRQRVQRPLLRALALPPPSELWEGLWLVLGRLVVSHRDVRILQSSTGSS